MVHDYCGGPVEREYIHTGLFYKCTKCGRQVTYKEVKNLPDIEPEGV